MSADYPVSIVVPTRNRPECFVSLLETLEHYHAKYGHRFQLVVADNSDDDRLRVRAQSASIPVDYQYSSDVLSVVDNFNRTVPRIRGEFACFMGDDDIVSSRLFELIALMQRHRLDAAIVDASLKCLYFWPGVTHKRWGDVGGRLYLSKPTGIARMTDLERELSNSRLRISDGPLGLPRAYFGVVSTHCIALATARYGQLFGGVSPDIFSSHLLSSVVKRCISVNLPFIAPGASRSSTSAARAERADVGKLRDNEHTGRFKELAWSPLVPDFYSPFTVWAQSLLQAGSLTGTRPRAGAYSYLYAKCLLFSRGHFSNVSRAIKAHRYSFGTAVLTAVTVGYVAFEYVVQKLPLLLRRSPGGADNCFADLPTSDAAAHRLNSYIGEVQLRYVHESK